MIVASLYTLTGRKMCVSFPFYTLLPVCMCNATQLVFECIFILHALSMSSDVWGKE